MKPSQYDAEHDGEETKVSTAERWDIRPALPWRAAVRKTGLNRPF